MNIFITTRLIIFTLLAFSVCQPAYSANLKTPISIKVKDKTDSDSDREENEEDNEDRLQITEISKDWETCELQIEIRNKGEVQRTCELEWYFIGEDTPMYDVDDDSKPEPKLAVLDFGKKTVVVKPKSRSKQKVKSKKFTYENEFIQGESYSTGYFYFDEREGGQTYEGYVVLVKTGDLLLATDASSDKYLKKEWMKKLHQ